MPTGTTITIEVSTTAAQTLMADAIRLVRTDNVTDDNFLVAPNSPAIDAGALDDPFVNEPGPNGGRINLGAQGNTTQATTSQAELIQVLSPNGQEKYESGDQMLIQWHQNGAFSKPADQAYQLTIANQLPVSYWRLGRNVGHRGR